jgi:hypothetical protein
MQPLPLAWNQETGNRMIGADVWLVAVVSQDEKVPRGPAFSDPSRLCYAGYPLGAWLG